MAAKRVENYRDTENQTESDEEEFDEVSLESAESSVFTSPLSKQGKLFPRSRTNKNGLPIEVQRTILLSVLLFNGKDNFTRDICDKNPSLLGEKNSSRRTACRSKRRHFLKIRADHPDHFVQLCEEFGVTIPENNSLFKLPNFGSPAPESFSTPDTRLIRIDTETSSQPKERNSFASSTSIMALKLYGTFKKTYA